MSDQMILTLISPKIQPARDSLAAALDIVNDRWTLHIVRAVAFGAVRFTDILREVGAPRDVLSTRLRTLVEKGVLRPHEPHRGRMSGYELTPKGRDLGPVILAMKQWGDLHCDTPGEPLTFVHRDCGHVFVPEMSCRACGSPLTEGGVHIVPEDGRGH